MIPSPIVFLIDVDSVASYPPASATVKHISTPPGHEPGATMPTDGGDSEEVLARFAKVGIDVDTLASQLQDERVKSFVKSWSELLTVIATKG
jgi:hypothetical protein